MPQLLQPYNPWFMGIEAATAAAIIGGAIDKAPSMGVIAGIAIAVGSWNYYVQKEYPVPKKLVEKAEALKYKQELRTVQRDAPDISSQDQQELAASLTMEWANKKVYNAVAQF